MAAKLATDYELDGCRAQRAAAKEKLEQWEANHKWRVATARALGVGEGARSKAWQSLTDTFEACQRRVQVLKTALRSHQVHLDAFAANEVELKAEQTNANQRLRVALGRLEMVSQTAVERLISVSLGEELDWLKAAAPTTAPTSEMVLAVSDQAYSVPRLQPLARRLTGSR